MNVLKIKNGGVRFLTFAKFYDLVHLHEYVKDSMNLISLPVNADTVELKCIETHGMTWKEVHSLLSTGAPWDIETLYKKFNYNVQLIPM